MPRSTTCSCSFRRSEVFDHGLPARFAGASGRETILAHALLAAGGGVRRRRHPDLGTRPRPPHRGGALLRLPCAGLDRRGHLVGGRPHSRRRNDDHLDHRHCRSRRARRRLADTTARRLAPRGRLPRNGHLALRRDREPPQACDQHGLSAGPGGLRRQPALHPPFPGSAGRAAARCLLSGIPRFDGFLLDGLLLPADGHPAAPGAGHARSRPGARGGLVLRPAVAGGPFPVARPHERSLGLVPAADPLVAAAKIARRRRIANDDTGRRRRTA